MKIFSNIINAEYDPKDKFRDYINKINEKIVKNKSNTSMSQSTLLNIKDHASFVNTLSSVK
jgi:hypothetical protein